jgi:hypothetical protein
MASSLLASRAAPLPLLWCLLLSSLSSAVVADEHDEHSSGEHADDEAMDVYTILAIVFLSLFGVVVLVRLVVYAVGCSCFVEEAATSTTVVRIEKTATTADTSAKGSAAVVKVKASEKVEVKAKVGGDAV